MAIAFKLTSNFSAKLKSNLSKKPDRALDFGARILLSKIIKYLRIQLTNSITQAAYSKSVCNWLHNLDM